MKLDFDEKTKQSENGLITRSISDCYVALSTKIAKTAREHLMRTTP